MQKSYIKFNSSSKREHSNNLKYDILKGNVNRNYVKIAILDKLFIDIAV